MRYCQVNITIYYSTTTDHLGSICQLIEADGTVGEQTNYDPWGRIRNLHSWQYDQSARLNLIPRGYTGHEMLREFGLINMNGRVYDPLTSRFLSPDNYVQAPYNPQNYNRYTYALNNPLRYVDPDGEVPIIIPIIGAIIGAYIGGAAANNWDWTPWKNGNGDKSWNFNSPDTYVGIFLGAVAGALISSYAYGILVESASINLTLGISFGDAFNGFANFVVSNSGIIFEGIGYTTIAGGGAFITYKSIQKLEQHAPNTVEYPKYDYPFYHGDEYDAITLGLEVSKISKLEVKGYYTNNGFYFEPISGYVNGVYKENSIKKCYSYTPIFRDKRTDISYLVPGCCNYYRIYYSFHFHPSSSGPSKRDVKWAQYHHIRSYMIGWNGKIYGTWDGMKGYTGYSIYDIKAGKYSLMNDYYGLYGPVLY